jgi:hypothetical protein
MIMRTFYIKPAMAHFLSLESNVKYSEETIRNKLISMVLTSKQIKKNFPDFKGCSCTSTSCKMNSDAFYTYIINSMVFSDGKPECSYYFSSNETPIIINSDSFTFV